MTETVSVRKDDLRLIIDMASEVPQAQESVTRLYEALARCGEALNGTSENVPPVHLGEYARVDIMGHDWRTGWVSDGSMAGAACLDVRDGSGRLVAKVPPHSVYLYTPLDPPRPGESRAALPAGDESGEDVGCVCDEDGMDPDCPEHGNPF